MARITVTGLTRARMLAEQALNIVGGAVSGDNLILQRRDGSTIDLGSVRGVKGDKGDPGGLGSSAGGDLTGTYPNPTIVSALKDAAANVASLRTLGTGSLQAVAGTDSRLSNSRTPTGTAGGILSGTYPNPTLADTGWIDLPLSNSWVAYDARTPQYRRFAGRVYFRGLIKNGAVGSVFGTVPTGFRPEFRVDTDHHFPVVSNGAFGHVRVFASNGTLDLPAGSNAWADLSTVQFNVA